MARKNNDQQYMQIIEAAIFAFGQPMTVKQLSETVLAEFKISQRKITSLVKELQLKYEGHGIELVQVAGGYRFQTRSMFSPWVSLLWQEKAPRYSRAMLETLALIAYRQPITRGEIEQVRGVAVSSNIIRSLQERGWVKVVGHKEVAGRPALFATTASFLDYFGLQCLEDLPQVTEQLAAQAEKSTLN
ncbi:SMC-Scp complex subunit ScpB [Catenovulum sediminis]|uniref:SMC-Scp complex subunit ScpB n=1 Tax=Catenovulum sediminis TaxID=1740262 RepID=A0ABV1RMT2_9ALTE